MASKYIKIILVCLLAVSGIGGAYAASPDGIPSCAPLDSATARKLDARMAEYLAAIERESPQVKKAESDFLIETCADSLIRQYVAISVYDHYMASKLMGDEAIAIHVFDKWFQSGKVRMRSEADMLAAKIFAEFNRHSLIGMQAPEMILYAMDGSPVNVPDADSGSRRFNILFFYDADCASCKVQTILLRNVLEEGNFPVDLYAVYASDDMEAWKSYVDKQLDIEAAGTKVVDLWDPELESDFQRKYGVIRTPRMFLIGPDGTILGRNLDAGSLSVMLHGIFDEKELEYGAEESVMLYDRLFGTGPSRQDIVDVAGHIASRTLEKGDTLMFRQMAGDLLYYLGSHRGEGVKEGLSYVIDEYVLSKEDVWRSSDDSLKVIGYAEMMRDLLGRSVPGSKIADMKVPAHKQTLRKGKDGEFRLGKLNGNRNIIIFHTEGCHVCAAEKDAAYELLREEKDIVVLLVDIDDIISSSPSLANALFDSFDLSSLPYIIETDRKGRIVRRYVSLQR